MPDQEVAVQEEPKRKIGNSWYSILIMMASGRLLELFKIDFIIGASLGLLIASVVEYYVEHPKDSFADWLKKNLLVAALMIICLWFGPILFSRWLTSHWAYGIYGFSCVILIYLVRTIIKRKYYLSLTPTKRREEALVILLLGVLGGLVMASLSFFPK